MVPLFMGKKYFIQVRNQTHPKVALPVPDASPRPPPPLRIKGVVRSPPPPLLPPPPHPLAQDTREILTVDMLHRAWTNYL